MDPFCSFSNLILDIVPCSDDFLILHLSLVKSTFSLISNYFCVIVNLLVVHIYKSLRQFISKVQSDSKYTQITSLYHSHDYVEDILASIADQPCCATIILDGAQQNKDNGRKYEKYCIDVEKENGGYVVFLLLIEVMVDIVKDQKKDYAAR